jgi:hypothetical protein
MLGREVGVGRQLSVYCRAQSSITALWGKMLSDEELGLKMDRHKLKSQYYHLLDE